MTGLLLGGTASAHWSAGGSGSAAAYTATLTSLTLSPGTPTTQLVPGSSAGVELVISNPDPVAVHVARLSLATDQGTGGFAVDPAHGGCALSALHLPPATAGWDVPARSGGTHGTLTVSLPAALAMDNTAASACQGATFTVYLSAAA